MELICCLYVQYPYEVETPVRFPNLIESFISEICVTEILVVVIYDFLQVSLFLKLINVFELRTILVKLVEISKLCDSSKMVKTTVT